MPKHHWNTMYHTHNITFVFYLS